MAELQHSRRQRKATILDPHVAELDEREQKAPRRGTCEARGARDLAQRQRRVVCIEGADHRQATLERLDEIRLARLHDRKHALRRLGHLLPAFVSSSSRTVPSSSAVGSAVRAISGAVASSQPVAARAASTDTPG